MQINDITHLVKFILTVYFMMMFINRDWLISKISRVRPYLPNISRNFKLIMFFFYNKI
jgi:hypothetical protein